MASSVSSTKVAFIFHQTQLPENLGAAARAMANFGLTDMRLVAPQCDPLDGKAYALAAGAESLVQQAKIFDDLDASIADCQLIYGTCGDPRHLIKDIIPLPALNGEISKHPADTKIGIIFGPERTGLDNDILGRCHGIIHIPTMPSFSSINLAQAVILIAYQLRQYQQEFETSLVTGETKLATQEAVQAFLGALETTLDAHNYWRVLAKKPIMWRNLQNIFTRFQLTEQDLKTLRGMINTIAKKNRS